MGKRLHFFYHLLGLPFNKGFFARTSAIDIQGSANNTPTVACLRAHSYSITPAVFHLFFKSFLPAFLRVFIPSFNALSFLKNNRFVVLTFL